MHRLYNIQVFDWEAERLGVLKHIHSMLSLSKTVAKLRGSKVEFGRSTNLSSSGIITFLYSSSSKIYRHLIRIVCRQTVAMIAKYILRRISQSFLLQIGPPRPSAEAESPSSPPPCRLRGLCASGSIETLLSFANNELGHVEHLPARTW